MRQGYAGLPSSDEQEYVSESRMPMSLPSLVRLQLAACLLGVVTQFLPGISWTGHFYGLSYMSGPWISSVEPDSPAARDGFEAGDLIEAPDGVEAVRQALASIRPGHPQALSIRRGERSLILQASAPKPELAAVWYDDVWNPIAGGIFLLLGSWSTPPHRSPRRRGGG
jgi:S1-C subfamily serine protease